MSRPSKVTTEVAAENAVPTAVSVEGQDIRIMEGGLTL